MQGLVTDPRAVGAYVGDASRIDGWADALIRPRDDDEVAEALAYAAGRNWPVTVVGARTSTTGSAVPHGGLVLSTEQLRGCEVVGDRAVCAAGERLGDVARLAADHGWHLPPDPTSRDEATVGATVATNASGARSYRFGSTRAWLTSVRVVLADGQTVDVEAGQPPPPGWPVPIWPEPRVKTAAGYRSGGAFLDLLVGSEGTLGVVTRATFRLRPSPSQVLGAMAFFDDVDAAEGFVDALRDGGAEPRCIEWFDATSLAMASAGPEGPPAAQAAVFTEFEDEAALDWLATHTAAAREVAVASDAVGLKRFASWRARVPLAVAERLAATGMRKVGTDLAVPRAAGAEMRKAYRAVTMPSVLFGHIGDEHLHLNLFAADEAERGRAMQIHADLAAQAVSLGGTVSGEHGIGKVKRHLFAAMVGESVLSDFRALRRAADPRAMLAPGNLT